MAQETLNAGSVGSVNATWTDSANIVEQYNVATASFAQTAAGDYSGDANLEDTAQTPTAINSFKLIYWNSGVSIDDDTFSLQVYNNHTTAWEELGTDLQESETEYDDTYLAAIQAKFAAAADKAAFVNNLAVRWAIVLTKGADGVQISTQGIEMEIEYTAGGNAPTSVFNGPLVGPLGGPIQ